MLYCSILIEQYSTEGNERSVLKIVLSARKLFGIYPFSNNVHTSHFIALIVYTFQSGMPNLVKIDQKIRKLFAVKLSSAIFSKE